MNPAADHARISADAAAESIRAVNHATQHLADFGIGDVYAITGSLASAESRLEQTCRQLAAILRCRAEHGALRHDANGDVDASIMNAVADLTDAGTLATLASQLFARAQHELAPIADVQPEVATT